MDDSEAEGRTGIRLNRFLASCGLGSRRKCEELITEGRVEINGTIVTGFGNRVQPDDYVRVDGKIVRGEGEITVMLNKPKGFLCTHSDPEGRETIYELLPARFRNLNYIGRLDRDSQGLILLTNSGDLNQRLSHPRHQLEKEYNVSLNRAFNAEADIPKLLKGIQLSEGLAVAEAVIPHSARRLTIVLTQGYNRQIRRMFAKLDYKVRLLERVRIGQLTVPDLSTGEHRVMGKRDIERACQNPGSRRRSN